MYVASYKKINVELTISLVSVWPDRCFLFVWGGTRETSDWWARLLNQLTRTYRRPVADPTSLPNRSELRWAPTYAVKPKESHNFLLIQGRSQT